MTRRGGGGAQARAAPIELDRIMADLFDKHTAVSSFPGDDNYYSLPFHTESNFSNDQSKTTDFFPCIYIYDLLINVLNHHTKWTPKKSLVRIHDSILHKIGQKFLLWNVYLENDTQMFRAGFLSKIPVARNFRVFNRTGHI